MTRWGPRPFLCGPPCASPLEFSASAHPELDLERNPVIEAKQQQNLRPHETKRLKGEVGHRSAGHLILSKGRYTLPRHFLGDSVDRQVARELKTRLSIDRKRRLYPLNPPRNEVDRREFVGFKRPGANVVIAPVLVALETCCIDCQLGMRAVDRAV